MKMKGKIEEPVQTSATSSTKNPTWAGLESNPCLDSERPAPNHLSRNAEFNPVNGELGTPYLRAAKTKTLSVMHRAKKLKHQRPERVKAWN